MTHFGHSAPDIAVPHNCPLMPDGVVAFGRRSGGSMRRRDFIALVGGSVGAAWPLTARAQQPAKLPTIGLLVPSARSVTTKWIGAFVERLGQLGWVEGSTIAIEYRWAEGRPERYPEFASEFVRNKVDVIVTSSLAVLAAKQATTVIPIVFAVAVDPVASGMVASLNRPGGNVTGLSLQQTDVGPKRLELLLEVVPSLHRLAILGNVGYSSAAQKMAEVQIAAKALGLEVARIEIRRAEDIEPAFKAIMGAAQALYVCGDALMTTNSVRINTLVLAARLPTMFPNREHVERGGLMSYGASFADLYRRSADIVDKILHGTKPEDIPVEQPTKFELIINLTTANALGLTVPQILLATADEVIE